MTDKLIDIDAGTLGEPGGANLLRPSVKPDKPTQYRYGLKHPYLEPDRLSMEIPRRLLVFPFPLI